MKIIILLLIHLLLFCFNNCVIAQKEGDNWTFMDSTGIKFLSETDEKIFYKTNLKTPYPISGATESQATLSDKNGNLKFYLQTDYWFDAPEDYLDPYKAGIIYNKNNEPLNNTDSIYCNLSAPDGAVFLTDPQNENVTHLFALSMKYITFTAEDLIYYLVYHQINNATQTVEIKNQILYQSKNLDEKLSAIRHANGKDWWIFIYDRTANTFVRFLLTEQGLSAPTFQAIGEIFPSNYSLTAAMTFSPQGDKLAFLGDSNNTGYCGLLDFDRCTGLFSNWKRLDVFNWFGYSCAFSPNGKILYLTALYGLYQYDLTAANIPATRKKLYQVSSTYLVLQLKLAPDNRIYFTMTCDGCDTVQHRNHLYLHTIDYPDRWGEACGVHIKKHYLGGQKSGSGLPNIPNYRLPALPFAVTGPNRAICKGQTVVIGAPAQSCQTYSWAPAQTLDDPAAPFATTTYTLTTTYEGQTDVQTVTVYVGQYPAQIHATQTPSGAPPFTVTFDFDPVLPGFDFVWLFHDDTKDSADLATKNYPAPGIYPVKLLTRALNGNCVDTLFYSLNVSITGIKEDEKNDYAVNLYPNPANESLTVEHDFKNATLDLIDGTGRVVHAQNAPNLKTVIDLRRFAKGIYYVRLFTNFNQILSVEKLIIH